MLLRARRRIRRDVPSDIPDLPCALPSSTTGSTPGAAPSWRWPRCSRCFRRPTCSRSSTSWRRTIARAWDRARSARRSSSACRSRARRSGATCRSSRARSSASTVRLRPRHLQFARGGQGRAHDARATAHLLLLYADALCVGPAGPVPAPGRPRPRRPGTRGPPHPSPACARGTAPRARASTTSSRYRTPSRERIRRCYGPRVDGDLSARRRCPRAADAGAASDAPMSPCRASFRTSAST